MVDGEEELRVASFSPLACKLLASEHVHYNFTAKKKQPHFIRDLDQPSFHSSRSTVAEVVISAIFALD